jgi:hypothetical protein
MADSPTPLRAVAPEERRPPRRPGAAVILVLLYGVLFLAGLVLLRARSPLFHRKAPASTAAGHRRAGAPPVARSTLLSGSGLFSAARDEYLRGLAATCCTCGCEKTLPDCLRTEKSCTRSPEAATALYVGFQ